MKKTIIILVIIISLSMVLVSCTSKSIKIENFDGEIIEILKDGLTDEQITILEDVEAGSNLTTLLQSGLFTQQQLIDLKLIPDVEERNTFKGFLENDFSKIDIDSLNLEGLSEAQVEAVKKLIAGEMTMQEIISSQIITRPQLATIGLVTARGGMGEGAKGNN